MKYSTWLTVQIWAVNVIKEGIINFKYFSFEIKSYSLFHQFEVVVIKKIRQQTCCSYLLSYSSPLPCQTPKSNLHHLQKIFPEKHNGHASSKIGYPIIYKFFKDFSNHSKKTNRVVAFSSKPFQNIFKYRDHQWDLPKIWKTRLF